ncbi:dynein heavy chain [Gurleya vavrai]
MMRGGNAEVPERCNRLYLLPNKSILFLLINPFKIEKILYELFEVQEIIFKNSYILGIKEEQEDIFFEKPIDIEENFCKTINLFEATLKQILFNKLTLKIESKKLNENYTNQRLEINFSKTESKLLTKNIYPMHHHLEYYKKNDMIMTSMTKRIFSCFILYFYNDLNGIILYGKSGSGKTETVKYFAKKLGRKIFLYCCDEKTNIIILDEIFTKCAKTDSFLCLDEFNRLNAETMSTMHKLISKYKKSCKTKIYLFCTMNLGY